MDGLGIAGKGLASGSYHYHVRLAALAQMTGGEIWGSHLVQALAAWTRPKNVACQASSLFLLLSIEICEKVAYNMLIKAAGTIADTYPFPAEVVHKKSAFALLERGCYFLCVSFRAATINPAVQVNI